MVVLETIRPSMPAARTTCAIPSSAGASRSGAIFSSKGFAIPIFTRASVSTPSSRVSSSRFCKPRRPGVLGEETFTAHIIGQRRQHRESFGIIGNAIFAVLVGADIDAHKALAFSPRQIFRRDSHTRIVEAHAVDDGIVLGEAEQARTGIAPLAAGA